MAQQKQLILFDVDGTLTIPRKQIMSDMLETLNKLTLQENIDIGFVGGSDLDKQKEQLLEENFNLFDWRFSENGLLAYKNNEMIHRKSFLDELGEQHNNHLINIFLSVLSNIDIPKKRGTFIEYRTGMINLCPVGRSCSQEEREEFNSYDLKHNIRQNMITKIQELWNEYITKNNLQNLPKLKYSIGGQISIDIFPEGWDKTYCLQFVEDKYDKIYFFGDKTDKGGNDYEIYNHPLITGFRVEKYQDTINILNRVFL